MGKGKKGRNGFTRRQFIQASGLAGAAMMLPMRGLMRDARGQIVAQIPFPGNKLPQFVDVLPNLNIISDLGSQIELQMTEFKSNVLPTGFVPANGPTYLGTSVWGYLTPGQASGFDAIPSYIGPIIVATRGAATEINFVNNLGRADLSGITAYRQALDQTLHWADPPSEANVCSMAADLPAAGDCLSNYAGSIPAVPHLHGGEVPPVLDGGPDAWYTSDGLASGHGYYSLGLSQGAAARGNFAVYKYPNTQEAANIWFHDHALGITRLNVYAGLAGGYIIVDPARASIDSLLPGPMVPLILQDRMFDINGELFFDNVGINLEHPYWVPEFVGDTIVVNGKVWPYFNVDRKRYRFLFLNGSNARAYDMSLIDPITGIRGPRMWVIGTDGGYLDKPVEINPNASGQQTKTGVQKSLVIMPGERYEVIIDFNDPLWPLFGTTQPVNLVLQNTARTPFPGGAPAAKSTTGRIMQFRVSGNKPADGSYNPSVATPAPLRTSPIVRLVNPATGTQAVTPKLTRRLTLNEIMGPGGPLEVVVNNTKWNGVSTGPNFPGGLRGDFVQDPSGLNPFDARYSEFPAEGDTELWEIINLTADAHPIHLHLVQFQLMNRQAFDIAGYTAAYDAAFIGGIYIPAYGPPLDYFKSDYQYTTALPNPIPQPFIVGGNPDVAPFINPKKYPIMPPLPHEHGWKDTVIMYPGEITRIMVRWAPTDLAAGTSSTNAYFPFDPNSGHGYVWHCHIIDHEDNEMMRPTSVEANPNALRTVIKGEHY